MIKILSLFVAAAVAGAALVAAPVASAGAIRYASPAGSGTACTVAVPCSLTEAITNALDGDVVQLTADEYRLTSTLDVNADNLTIQGPAGMTEPADFLAYLIFPSQSEGGVPDNDAKIRIFGTGTHFQRLAITGVADGAALVGAGFATARTTYDRVRITNNGISDTLVGRGTTITNSVIKQEGAGTFGSAVAISGTITGSTIYSRNATAVLSSSSYTSAPNCSLVIRNSLLWGGYANLAVDDTGSGTCAGLNVDYDYSWVPAPGGGGFGGGVRVTGSSFPVIGFHNLPESPGVFDPTNPSDTYLSDLVLPPGSPAINAGCTAGCSTNDYYGRPRPIGAANDMGAMEQSLPPASSVLGIGSRTQSAARLTALLRPRGAVTAYQFQVRRVGTTTWSSVGGGTLSTGLFGASSVSRRATSLRPDTTYDARLIASNSRGSRTPAPLSRFRTLAPPTLSVRVLRVKPSRRAIRVSSSALVSHPGMLAQRATSRSNGRTVTRCSTSRTATSASAFPLTCTMGKSARKALRRGSLKVTLKTTLAPGSGGSVTTLNRFTIRRKR